MVESEELKEEEIIARILKGDKFMYELIVRRYNPFLYKIGRSYNLSHEITEDLMQESFIDAYKNLASFEGRSSFKTWIIRIMLNNCYRKTKKSSYKKEIMIDVDDEMNAYYMGGTNDTEQLITNKELKNILEEALSKIPFEYRIVFSLREVNGMSVRETAELLELTESNVKVRLSRAKGMLRGIIENSYVVEELYEFNLVHCTPMVKRVMEKINKL